MNGLLHGVTSAARDRIHGYRHEAERARLVRGAASVHRPAYWRRVAAATLHRLADALAPQHEDGQARSVPRGLGTSGNPPLT